MDAENRSLESVDLREAQFTSWQVFASYALAALAAIIIPLALFFPAFFRLEKNPKRLLDDGVPVVETFWEFSIVASILLILIALAAVVLLVKKHPRKILYVALAATIVCFGASYLHERAKQAKIAALYSSSSGNPNTPRDIRNAVEKFANAYADLERTYIESETYGRAWTALWVATFAFWFSWLLQFSRDEYKRAWNWTLSKVPMFEQKFKNCQSCGGSNYFEASRCKHCNTPFVKA